MDDLEERHMEVTLQKWLQAPIHLGNMSTYEGKCSNFIDSCLHSSLKQVKAKHSNKDQETKKMFLTIYLYSCWSIDVECLGIDTKEVGSELDLETIVEIFPPSCALILIPRQHRW